MAKSTTLSLVEDEEESQQEEAPTQDIHALAQTIARLEASLTLAHDRITLLEQKAHTEHQIELGPNELAAIGNALKPQIQQIIIDHLKEHLGIAPPALRGDG